MFGSVLISLIREGDHKSQFNSISSIILMNNLPIAFIILIAHFCFQGFILFVVFLLPYIKKTWKIFLSLFLHNNFSLNVVGGIRGYYLKNGVQWTFLQQNSKLWKWMSCFFSCLWLVIGAAIHQNSLERPYSQPSLEEEPTTKDLNRGTVLCL